MYLPVAGKIRLIEEFSQQHSVRHVLDYRPFGGAVLKPNAVADLRGTRHRSRHGHGHIGARTTETVHDDIC